MSDPSLYSFPIAPILELGTKVASVVSACTGQPIVGPAAKLLHAIYELCRGVTQNIKLFSDIVYRCADLLGTINERRHEPRRLQEIQEELERLLKDIKNKVTSCSGQNYITAFIKQQENKSWVLEKHIEIDRLLQRFQIISDKELVKWQSNFVNSLEEDNCTLMKIVGNTGAENRVILEDILHACKSSTPDAQLVHKIVTEILKQHNGFDRAQAQGILLQLESTNGIPAEGQITFKEQRPIAGTDFDIYRASGSSAQMLALKYFRHNYNAEKIRPRLERYVSIWDALSDSEKRYIVPIVGYCLNCNSQQCIVTPWMEKGNILSFVKSNPMVNKRTLCYNLAKCLKALHVRAVPIAHGSIKSSNILINDLGEPLLSDLFMAKFVAENEDPPMHSYSEDPQWSWIAPEIRSAGDRAVLTVESDIYSFGMVVIEIMTGGLPYDCYRDKYPKTKAHEFLKFIDEGNLPARPQKVDDEMWDLLNRCWSATPSDRPSIQDIVEFFEGKKTS